MEKNYIVIFGVQEGKCWLGTCDFMVRESLTKKVTL